MRLAVTALALLALLAAAVSPLLLDGSLTCKMGNRSDVEGRCPVKLTAAPSHDSGGHYAECVSVHVWIKAADFSETPVIKISSDSTATIRPTMKKKLKKSNRYLAEKFVQCNAKVAVEISLWELVYDCVKAQAKTRVTVSYSTISMSCHVNHTVEDPVPNFRLSVNYSSKSITVTVEPGDKVHLSWCYRKNVVDCFAGSSSTRITINPAQSPSALLNIPYLMPCVCVQVFYTHTDAERHIQCPVKNDSLTDVRDVWLSSDLVLYEESLRLSSKCPAKDLKIFAALCWRQNEHLCTPVQNFTLEEEEVGPNLIYNTSAVDKHPQMCVQFSLKGNQNTSCPFQPDMSSWEVSIAPGKQSVSVYLVSSASATFSAQLCVLSETGCASRGQVYSVSVEGKSTEGRVNVPLQSIAERPCVQVWQSDPALQGRRILCPDYTRRRCGLYVVAAAIFVVTVALLRIFINSLTKNGAADWLSIQKPVLMVCSSEQPAHISAVCALASILQGDLNATVHMALWTQTSQRLTAAVAEAGAGAGAGPGVADLGPLPWLYGQWESVHTAQGKVLIIWSPEARKMYEKWREGKVNSDKIDRKTKNNKSGVEDEPKPNGGCKKERAAGEKKCAKVCDSRDWYTQTKASTVIEPVFTAALACLEGALRERKEQEVALVYFQGLGHSRDIPKSLRGVPRYCLPQDFSGLIQQLRGTNRRTKAAGARRHCWPRLMSKVLSVWLARQLAHRLRTLLPPTQGKTRQERRGTSWLRRPPDKTQCRLTFPVATEAAKPGPGHEDEALNGSPESREALISSLTCRPGTDFCSPGNTIPET